MAIASTISEKCRRYGASVGRRASRFWLVALLVAASSALIVYCRVVLGVSIVSTHLAYLPIVLVGLWWGRRAVWVAVFFGAWIVVLRGLAPTGESLAADVGRGLVFVLVGFSVGTASEKAEAARRAEETSRRRLERTRQKLLDAERLASIGQLSAGVAHEINNPLGTVLLYANAMRKELPAEDPKRADLEMICSETTRCKNIVRGLLDFARQSRVSKEPIDLAALIGEVASITRPRASQVGVHLACDLPDDLPSMMLDGAQVRQALINLVDNAIDATAFRPPPAERGEVRLSARLSPRGESVRIDVSDNGCGIPKENLTKLFTPFFTTKEMGKGTGLGLAIAYGVVKMHSGEITVDSREHEGTTFSVRLPLGGDVDGNELPQGGTP